MPDRPALDRLVRGAVNDRWRGIHDGDGLAANCYIAAAIADLPGGNPDHLTWTVVGGGGDRGLRDGDIGAAGRVNHRGRIEIPG